ncbi:MAG: hypothetical protein QOJ64_1237 [Acidobacteriota bacterium]|jgi:HEAT repeat protein|nr:hypothetical protein [Acidobacteriota bacterium]
MDPVPESDDSLSAARQGVHPAIVAVLLVVAFALGFWATSAFKQRRARQPIIVAPRDLKLSKLAPPEISVTSMPGEGSLTAYEQRTLTIALDELSDGSSDALNTLEALGMKAVPALTRALASDNSDVRMNAATVLNQIAAGPDTDPNSDEDRERLRPVFQGAGTSAALARLANDPEDQTRQSVAYALGNIGERSAYRTLISMAQDPEPDVRIGVAFALGRLRNPGAVNTLVALLSDDDDSVRASAADALKFFDAPVVKSALSDRLAQESDPDTVERIKAALES